MCGVAQLEPYLSSPTSARSSHGPVYHRTGDTSFIGLQSPTDPAGPITASITGLTPAVLKAADASAAACEKVCCEAIAISDGQKTGPCGVWQWLDKTKFPTGGCWLGVDPLTRQPKYVENPRPGERWVGGSGNLGPPSQWGWALIIVVLVVATVRRSF